jgi:hypothetical protein
MDVRHQGQMRALEILDILISLIYKKKIIQVNTLFKEKE